MACDIHIILCHMHQGMKKGGVWDCSEYLYNLLNLEFHLGVPMGFCMRCPIYLAMYIFAMQDRMVHMLVVHGSTESKILKWRDSQEVVESLKLTGFSEDNY